MAINNKKKEITLIQDLATPHNNVLIGGFKNYPQINIRLWYARKGDEEKYQWKKNITHEHFAAQIYGTKLNWKFIKYCLIHTRERYVIVGWANSNTRLLRLLFFLLRRPYNHWTDLPEEIPNSAGIEKKFLRWTAYKILKHSKSHVFCAGELTLDYFRRLEFEGRRLTNLPIFVESEEDLSVYYTLQETIFAKYRIRQGDFLLTAGSRIVREKGYDLLIKAMALLNEEFRCRIKVLIVGSGPCVKELEQLIKDLKLTNHVVLENWLDIADFKALIANSDVFVHPARVDAYGGTTLGMALGRPVIGSYGAGAAVDRIEHGVNGFLYNPEDINSLAKYITMLYRNPDMRRRMGEAALETARAWPPERGVKILLENAI